MLLGLPGIAAAQSITLDVPLVADPKLDASSGGLVVAGSPAGGKAGVPIVFRGNLTGATTTTAFSVKISVLQNGSPVKTLIDGASAKVNTSWRYVWDGKLGSGYAAPGSYTIKLDASGALSGSASRTVNVVRLGARSVKFTGSDRVSMAYHAAGPFSVDAAGASWTSTKSTLATGCLDDAYGNPIDTVAPWADLGTPPVKPTGYIVDRGRSLPVAYVGGGAVSVELLLGDSAAGKGAATGCGYPLNGMPIRVSVGGAPSGAIQPGAKVALAAPAAAKGLGKRDYNLDLVFEYQASDGSWKRINGFQRTRHTMYTVVGKSRVTGSGAAALPFVAAIDDAAKWAAGSTIADGASAVDLITKGVNQKKGLRYDNVAGAPAYAEGWDSSTSLAFSDFLSKARGSTVNCLDCACLVTVYSRSVGADCDGVILGWDFALNYIRGIGFSTFVQDVFNTGYGSFSYHAVATRTQGATINDACLEVDDGSYPGSPNATRVPRLPMNMDFARYRQKLTPQTFDITGTISPSQN